MPIKRRERRRRHEQIVFSFALLAGVPGMLGLAVVLAAGGFPAKAWWTAVILVLPVWFGFAWAARARVVNSLYTVANLLSGLREGDYTLRARRQAEGDALSEVTREVNVLSQALQNRRLSELEAATLLTTVMREIDVAIFAFDDKRRMRLANHAGQLLLDQPALSLIGKTAEEVGLAACLDSPQDSALDLEFPGAAGRWGLRRSRFREGGRPHTLIVLADLSRTLREEERIAWQRLVRVLGHELNNSLAPIKSIAGSLGRLLERPSSQRASDWEDDLKHGLDIIGTRSDSLARFLEAYSRLARLPKPNRQPFDLRAAIRRIVSLETRVPVALDPTASSLTLRADEAQIEQALINLVKNAVDAALEEPRDTPRVAVEWVVIDNHVEIHIDDNGPGVPSTTNLFVPFFTTKESGSGIGLVLARQIAENHTGTVSLQNHRGTRGCRATLTLPF